MTRYQLWVDGTPFGPAQDVFMDAVHDALDAGYARPDEYGRIVMDAAAEIKTLTPAPALH